MLKIQKMKAVATHSEMLSTAGTGMGMIKENAQISILAR